MTRHPWVPLLALAAAAAPLRGAITLDGLRAQCAQVREAVAKWRSGPAGAGRVVLVLGARTQEGQRFHLNPHPANVAAKWIYLDLNEHEPSAEAHLQCDFNDAGQMDLVAGALAGQVDALLFDHSVIKFNRWSLAQLRAVRRMLAPRGTFFLPLETWGGLSFLPDPEGAGETKEVYRDRLAGRIDRLMRTQAPEPLPSVLLVPQRGLTLDARDRAAAVRRWMMLFFLPRLEKVCKEAGFGSTAYVKFTPLFLQGSPEFASGIEHLACKP